MSEMKVFALFGSDEDLMRDSRGKWLVGVFTSVTGYQEAIKADQKRYLAGPDDRPHDLHYWTHEFNLDEAEFLVL